jgi:hypothetical protein
MLSCRQTVGFWFSFAWKANLLFKWRMLNVRNLGRNQSNIDSLNLSWFDFPKNKILGLRFQYVSCVGFAFLQGTISEMLNQSPNFYKTLGGLILLEVTPTLFSVVDKR